MNRPRQVGEVIDNETPKLVYKERSGRVSGLV